ncbi:hypothetical protein GCM10022393_37450 [Aquimarina addita]|uniref:Lipoprotein n=1 Tax=Aquimarina addita TaxID=870485 RepID=A0ABP6URP9_9FLAO
MKKAYLYIQTFLVITLLIGCQFSEELNLNEDGTGKITFNFDGSELMQMGGDKITEGREEIIDTLVVFKEFLEENKDSILSLPIEQQEKLKKLENFEMHMVMNPETKEMKFDLYQDFQNVNELSDLLNNFKTASGAVHPKKDASAAGMVSPLSDTADEEPTKVVYSFKNNKFSRITEILDEEKLKQNVDSMASMEMFLASSKYKLKYNFPRKIKKISSDKAMFSLDGKSFTLEVGFMQFMNNPKLLDVEVELEE